MKAKRTYTGLIILLTISLSLSQNVYAQQWTGSTTKTGKIYRAGGVEVHTASDIYLKSGFGMAGIKLSETPGRAQVRFRSSFAGGYSESSRSDFVFEIGRYQGHGTNIGNGTEVFRLGYSKAYFRGNVGIGTSNPKDKLVVNGTIRAKKVRVMTDVNVADYVFADDYALRSLAEVEQYVQEHQHLPGVPSAQEVKEEGLEVAEFQNKLLEKIEELTLYVIEQEKRIAALEAQNELLKN